MVLFIRTIFCLKSINSGANLKENVPTWLVFFIHAMASSYNNIVASPGELLKIKLLDQMFGKVKDLNIRAVVGKSHAPSIMADVLRSHLQVLTLAT